MATMRGTHGGEAPARRAVHWAVASVLLVVGAMLIATTAYVAYVARLWVVAARGEPRT